MPKTQEVNTPAPIPAQTQEQIDAQIAALLSTKAVSGGSKNLAAEFERIARANNHTVTFAQAKVVAPKSPSDLAYYFRQAGGKVVTNKGRAGETAWTVMKLANGELAYPAAVKAEVDRLKALKTKQ